MKKLIIAIAAVAMSTMANAAVAQWGSGALNTAASKDGGWSSTGVMAAGVEVTMSVYLINDAETWATVSSYDQKGLYDWANGKESSYSDVNRNPSTSALIGAVTIKDSAAPGSTDFNAVVIATYTDATYGNMYMATTASFTTPASGTKAVSNLFGGTTGVKDWQPVPEPTSGLLLLLGMAGLALKRKQA